ncbi:MAG: SUMF1/EgtB/PvdO family nonheme iron enzyme [Verrucomicrobia bacterium]|nr:SUMF1/EgtB/PvdO family nonheme iron enzyme [Verrucomicrobiota bacterium]
MKTCLSFLVALAAQFSLATLTALAHPGSGIVVDKEGNVYFTHTGRGAGKIDAQGKLTYVHKDTGGHFIALDAEGSFSSAAGNRLFERITPSGAKPTLLYASGGAPLVVNRDGNLYYGSGFPGGDDTTPGGFTLTRMSPDGKKTLFSPEVKVTLEKLGESVTGLAADRDGTLFVACPSAILKVKMDGTVTTVIHPVVVKDCDFAPKESTSRFFHAPYLRGLDVTEEGTVYAAVAGCRCVVKISPEGKVETVLKSEQPWVPTGVAVHRGEVYILEYTNANGSPTEGWRPRVRKLGPDGKVTILLTVAPDDGSPAQVGSFPGSKAGDEREAGGIKLCWCPAGKFLMGSPRGEPERRPGEDQVEVTLTKGFWMGKYEVTQGEWKRVVGKLPGELTAGGGEGDDLPVYNVNYAEAEAFCRKLTEIAHASGKLPSDWEFRLPTEAQWEYACRAGTTTATSFGDKLNSQQANVLGKPYNGAEPGPSLNRATKVGSYPANAWGLHDMHGNVVEWCRDWYHQRLPGGADPDLSSVKGTRNGDGTFSRSRRGSAWTDDAWASRSAFRQRYEPERRADHIGIRVVAVRL